MAENEEKIITEDLKSQEKNLVKMTELEKSAERITDSVLSTLDESGHELDTEEDGDIFWIIQKVVWSIIKSILIIGVIGGLMWVIWGDMNQIKMPSFSFSESKEAVSKKIDQGKKAFSKTEKEAKKQEIPEKKNEISRHSIQPKKYQSVIAANWNMWLSEEYRKEKKIGFKTAIILLQDFEDFFSIPVALQIKGRTDSERKKKINTVLEKIDVLNGRYQEISGIFEREINEYSAQIPFLKEDSGIAESQFLSSVSERRSGSLESYIQRKVKNGNTQYENENQIWARQILIQEMNPYTQALINLKTNIKANEQALIKDVQVYNFLNDPFERVLR